MKNRKKFSLLSLCLLLAVVVILIMVNVLRNDSDDQASDNSEALNSFVELQIGKFERQCSLGLSSTYPDFWYEVNLGELTEESSEKNIESAEEQIIETEAICYYAEQNGITVTNDEIREQIENIISDGEEADNYQEIETACESAGTLFEEIVNKNQSYYAKQMYVDKIYFDEYNKYYEDTGQATREGSTDEVLDWDKEWEAIKSRFVASFKKTERYSALKAALDKDREIIEAESEEAFKEDIKISWYAYESVE